MTSETRELSANDGQPIALFDFVRGTQHWRYTTADRNQAHLGQTFTPLPIGATEIQIGTERRKLTRTVTLPASASVAGNWRPYPSSEVIALSVFLKHYGETDAFLDWIGRVMSPKFTNAGTLELTCEPSTTTARRIGLRRCWQIGCGLALYACGVDRNDHALPATVANASGLTVDAAAFASLPDGRLAGGYLEWVRPDGNIERRSISQHAGSAVTVAYGSHDLATGLQLTAYPGCAHTWADCSGYYSNGPNYGGDLNMPQRSPFDGNPVW